MAPLAVHRRVLVRVLPLAGLVGLVLLALLPRAASAHSNLVQSDPPAQSVLARAPSQVRLSFSEAVDPKSIQVSVLNAQRQPVDRGDAALAPGTNDAVAIGLGTDLANGVYTIQWKVTSAVDGHTTLGLVPFTVGDAGSLPPPGSAATTVETSAESGGALGVIARWWSVLAAVTLTGVFAFVPLMLSRALGILSSLAAPVPVRRGRVATESEGLSDDIVDQVGAAATGRLLRLAGLVLALFAAGSLLVLLEETQTRQGGSLASAFGAPMWDWLRETRRGTLWLIRAGLIVTMGIGLAVVTRDVRRSGRAAVARWWRWAVLAGLGAGALLTISLGSHSAALRSQESLATSIDFIHLLAVSLWVGGLAGFALTLLPALGPLGGPPRTRLLAGLVPRFSLVAGTSVGVIALTGLYQTVRLSGGWSTFVDDTWGRALLVKLALFGVLLLLGAFNLLVVSPRLGKLAGHMDRAARETAAQVRRHFRRAVLAEVGVAAVVLLVVGLMTGNSPGETTSFVPSGPFRPFVLDSSAEGLKGKLVLSPGRIGLNRFDLTVTDNGGAAPPSGTEVVLRISTLDQDTGISEAKMDAMGGGVYSATGSYLSVQGLWEVAALVRRPGVDEVRLPFQLSLAVDTGAQNVRSNKPAAPLERGRELYANNCVQCHGSGARGDGPLAQALNPRPVDLTVHVPLHTDQTLHDWIANGIARTAMPAWKEQFSDEEIQAIINYLRQVAEQTNQER